MTLEPKAEYKPLRHAELTEGREVRFVAIARWEYDDRTEWCVEYWEERGEADHDRCFDAEAEAVGHAEREFNLKSDDWRPGPNAFR